MNNKLIIIIALGIITIVNIINLKTYGDIPLNGLGITITLFFAISIIYGILNFELINRAPLIVWTVIFLVFFTILTTAVHMTENLGIIAIILAPLIDLTYWGSAFILSYTIVRSQENIVKFLINSFYLSIPIIAYYYFIRAYDTNNFGSLHFSGINEAYYLLMFLPIIFMMRANIFKFLGTVVVTIALFLSTKRTGIIALAVALIVYFLLNNSHNQKMRKNYFITVIIVISSVTAFIFLFNYFSDQTGGYLLNRFTTIEEDQGSGRMDIWKNTISLQLDSNFEGWIMGHGLNAVSRSFVGFSAHNDFLEVLYDYGIIGLILYVSLYIQLFSIAFKMHQNKYQYFPSFAISCVLFFILSLFSHLIIYPTFFIYVSFFWGMTIADFENSKLQKIHQLSPA